MEQPAFPGTPIAPVRRGAMLQLIAALVLTFAILPYAWGRTVVFWMLVGAPDWLYLVFLLLSLMAIMAVTRNLSTALDRPWLDRWLLWGVGGGWVAFNVIMVALKAGPLLAWWLVALTFVPATLWVVWLAWMFYRPLSWQRRAGVLAGLLVLGVFGLAIKAEGLTGDANVNFAWRWGKRQEKPLETGAGGADLTRISDNDFAQYLGPQRLAVVPQARLARDWNQRPPKLIWRRSVGAGWSSFVIVGDYALTQEQHGDQECTICYRLADGSIAWAHSDPIRYDKSLGGPGPRATPTVHAGRVYALGATGLLNCLDGATGQSIWSVNILFDNVGVNIPHGVCSSPLVIDDLVIVCPTGRDDISLAAYETYSGKRVWQAGRQCASYGSPLVAELGGVQQLLIHAGEGVAGYDHRSGRQLWSFPWTNAEKINCTQPIPNAGGPGRVFAGTGYNKGSTLLQVERSGSEWSCKQLWKNNLMKLKYTTAVLHEGHLYGLDDGILECLDVETGKKKWKEGRYGHGQLLLAGGLLLIQAESGEVVLVEPSPEELRELGRIAALGGKTWNNPALAGKYLLVRNDHEAACYELPLD